MDLTGQRLGKYELIQRLGQGGMAEVYKAFQPGVERFVAIKVLHRHIASDEDLVERFYREAKGIGRLDHPNIVRIIDFEGEGDDPYLVLDYVSGGTLTQYIHQKETLPPAEALNIAAQVADAMAYAHAQGIIHRDIKPDNIMFSDEHQRHVVLADFGLADLEDTTNITIQGGLVGTAGYVSPEALDGRGADERSDVYSLGIVLYQMLTGTTPYQASSPYSMMLKQIHDPLPSPREKNPALSLEVEALVLKALAKDPNERFQSAQEFYLAIQQMLTFMGAVVEKEGQPRTWESSQTPPSRALRLPKSQGFLQRWHELSETLFNLIGDSMKWRVFIAASAGVFLAALVTVLVLFVIPDRSDGSNAMSSEEQMMTEVEGSTTQSTGNDANPTVAVNNNNEEASNPSTTEPTATTVPEPPTLAAPQSIGLLRFADNDTAQAGDIILEVNEVTAPPEGSHYELWLVGQNADTTLNLGEVPFENGRIEWSYSTNENLLANYQQVTISLVPNDGSDQNLIAFMGGLAPEYINQLRGLIIADHSKGFLPNAVEQAKLTSLQATRLQDALSANDLAQAKLHAEEIVNILEGENGPHYGDLDQNGQINNSGDGFGMKTYLRGILAQTGRIMEHVQPTQELQSKADQLMALSESGLTASDKVIGFALQLLEAQEVNDNAKDLAYQLEWYVLEILEGPDLDPETGGIMAAYKYGLHMADVNLSPF